MLVHKCLNGRADVCTPVDTLPGRRQLRSAAARQLLVPRTSTLYQHRPTWVPLLWTSYVERPAGLSTYRQQIFWRLWQSTEETPVQHLNTLPLFAPQRLLMWRIINPLMIIIIFWPSVDIHALLLLLLLYCKKPCIIAAVTVLLAMSVYQVIVSNHLPVTSASTPFIGQ